jgi:plasmid stabilization system protein ParE
LSYSVRLLPDAEFDLARLVGFLVNKSPRAAERAGVGIERGILSLADFPERGRRAAEDDLRELVIAFSRRAYIVQYRIEHDTVRVTHIFHSLERR